MAGYDLTVGGGLGMTHGKTATYPRLADEFAFVPAARLLDAVRAIVIVQRDNGDRSDRRHARLKYLIADRGLAWFREQVEAVAGIPLENWRPLPRLDVAPIPGLAGDGGRDLVLRPFDRQRPRPRRAQSRAARHRA